MSVSAKDLSAWLSHFEALHPVGIDMGLSRVSAVWQTLCHRYDITRIAQQKIITVSGTNGKGSTCQMLAQLLADSGLRVGVYTSPHITDFNERIQINGQPVADAPIIRAFEAIESARGEITLSYFEATTLAGLLVFAWDNHERGVDFAILEVGLGGRLDAINVIDADAAILTSVGLDHQAYLGSDLSQIAVEKAGVFRPRCPAVYAQINSYQRVIDYAEMHDVALLHNGRDYQLSAEQLHFQGNDFPLPQSIIALGQHQCSNVGAAMVLLLTLGLLPTDYAERLADFQLVGRMQTIAEQPKVVVDVAHNVAAAQALVQRLQQHTPQDRCYAVIGLLADKDHVGVLSAVTGVFDKVFFATLDGERGFGGDVLLKHYQNLCDLPAEQYGSVADAFAAAKSQANDNDAIYAFGSFLVVEALHKIHQISP